MEWPWAQPDGAAAVHGCKPGSGFLNDGWEGFVKIPVRDGTDHIPGATIVGRRAGELINNLSLARVAGLGRRKLLDDQVDALGAQQRLRHALNRHALLVVFQAMDTAGKDGAIRHMVSGVSPQGCQVFSVQHPSVQERQHHFLWRATRDLPEHGRIGIFNRSYDEEVLIVCVHGNILRSERLPGALPGGNALWQGRYRATIDMERHLHANGTRIVKVLLHRSKDEQRKRLLARIDERDKNGRFSDADLTERRFWVAYMQASGQCLAATGSK